MDLNYYETLIAVADDCPVQASVVPPERGTTPTVAGLQYALLAAHPYTYTHADVLFQTWLRRQDLGEVAAADSARLRAEFFAKPQACLRSSPLAKKYGWGLVSDPAGRVALCPMESAEYQAWLTGAKGPVVKALRSRRA